MRTIDKTQTKPGVARGGAAPKNVFSCIQEKNFRGGPRDRIPSTLTFINGSHIK